MPESREVTIGDTNAVYGVSAKQKTRSRTEAIKVAVTKPGESTSETLSYSDAKKYVFTMPGEYRIKYTVKNYYSPYRQTTKYITIECSGEIPSTEEPEIPVDLTEPEDSAE